MSSGKKIGISEKTKRSACLVLKEAQDSHESAGKDPMGLAASGWYYCCLWFGEVSNAPSNLV